MSQKNFMSYGDAETLFTELGQELSDKVPKSQLTANNTDFRFGYDSNTGKYGYIINEGGADTVVPFKDCDSSEITVSAENQILSGYKDYDSNGNLITGTNAGYDAGVTQGEANMKDGVTVTAASQLLSGYKARTSDGTLVTGSDAGYSAGVTHGHADRDSGVTVTDPYHILSGYKGRKSNGELVTGTNGGWDAGYSSGRSQGHADRDTGVTVTSAAHVLNGYKARTNTGTLVTGTAVNPSGAKSITANGNGQDVTAYATVNVSVPNSNSDTYSFPANDTGGTKDLGATNSYRYVNAENVYNKGKADGGSGKKPISVAQITSKNGAGNTSPYSVTFSASPGAVYAIAWGGKNGSFPSAFIVSGCTNLGGKYEAYDGDTGVGLLIVQANSSSVTVSTNSNTWPYQGACVVTRVTSA